MGWIIAIIVGGVAGWLASMVMARDASMGMPTLILPSVQVNMRAGHLPEPESNGTRYLKIPLDVA